MTVAPLATALLIRISIPSFALSGRAGRSTSLPDPYKVRTPGTPANCPKIEANQRAPRCLSARIKQISQVAATRAVFE
jgi:hypothetical protein